MGWLNLYLVTVWLNISLLQAWTFGPGPERVGVYQSWGLGWFISISLGSLNCWPFWQTCRARVGVGWKSSGIYPHVAPLLLSFNIADSPHGLGQWISHHHCWPQRPPCHVSIYKEFPLYVFMVSGRNCPRVYSYILWENSRDYGILNFPI